MMKWKSNKDHATYLQEVARLNRKYHYENVFPNQKYECSKQARELMGITESDQYYS